MPQYLPQPKPISELIGKAFYDSHSYLRNKVYDEFWEAGGRGSLKSSWAALEQVIGVVADPQANAIAFRKVGDTVSDSIKPTFIWAIRALAWEPWWHVPKSGHTLTFIPTGQQILMRGLDDPMKIKSIKPRKGYFKYLWLEEGAEYDSLEEIESVTQSVLRGGPEFVQIVTYNPPVEPKHWINVAALPENRPPNRSVHFSCYTDAPPEWLGPKFLQDAETMKRKKPDKYANVYLGKSIGRSEAIIFSGYYRSDTFEVSKRLVPGGAPRYFIGRDEVEGPYFGGDFGFSQDPSTLVKCWRSIDGRRIYIEYAEFGRQIKNNAFPAFYGRVPGSKENMIYADCARPETIVHIADLGYIISGAEKWKGSIEDGIEWLTDHEIIIHDRCDELLDEAVTYCYKIDRHTKEVTSDIIDKNNHGWDAVRYAFFPLIQQAPKGIMDVDFLAEGASDTVDPELVHDQYSSEDDFLI